MRLVLLAVLTCAEFQEAPAHNASSQEAVDGLGLTSRVSNLLKGVKYARENDEHSNQLSRAEQPEEASSKISSENLNAFGQVNSGPARFVYQTSGNLPALQPLAQPSLQPLTQPLNRSFRTGAGIATGESRPSMVYPQFFAGPSYGEFAWIKPMEPAFFGAFPIYTQSSIPMLAQVSAVEELDTAIEEIALPEASVPSGNFGGADDSMENARGEVVLMEPMVTTRVLELPLNPLIPAQPVEPELIADNVIPSAILPSTGLENLTEEELIELGPAAPVAAVQPIQTVARQAAQNSALLESLLQEKAAAEAALAKMQAQIAYFDLKAKQQALRPVAPIAQPAPPMPAAQQSSMGYLRTDAVISDILKDMFKPLGNSSSVGNPFMSMNF